MLSTIKKEGSELIGESRGLQKLISEATIKEFIKLAKHLYCKKVVMYTEDVLLVEELFKQKFRLIRLAGTHYEVRAEVGVS